MRSKTKFVGFSKGTQDEIYAITMHCGSDAIVTIKVEERTPEGGREVLTMKLSALNTFDMIRTMLNRLVAVYLPDLAKDFMIPFFERLDVPFER